MFLSVLIGFYPVLVLAYFINCLICSVFRIQLIQRFYIWTLDKLFSYAATVIAEDHTTKFENARCDSSENFETFDEDLIERDIQLTEDGVRCNTELIDDEKRGFKLHHPNYLVKCGIEAIIEDSVTKRFTAAELRVWNFLGRNQSFVYMKKDHLNVLLAVWLFGLFIRYFIFLPCKCFTFFMSLFLTWFVGYLGQHFPVASVGKWLRTRGLESTIRLGLCPFSAVIRFHNVENRPKPNTICVANHTTPFDWCVLASDVTYAVVGQKHSGFFGLVEKIISAAVPTVWFDRDEILDRHLTARRLKEHTHSPDAVPLLIFPEGTCINNTSVMKFKKGCFEVGAPIHPVAIKYNPLFADCFWNSSQDSLLQYTFKMMTSWAMVVDVWYLPPTQMRPDEDGIAFARRVQQSIAHCGGMLNIDWDGELKRRRPKDTLRVAQQKYISQYVIPPESSPIKKP
ncbi:1-acylglycerol-3-phosphate O-acyltransferase 6 (Lysophosphatidic acid acyltransferase zeta) [Fasciolopsis buskii]|uniref:1-acylglycerol-3-phosphate O-acyltransferase 6 (Lysophosphatidic acid acyltransferase zeta) n=1 Tax=Fasciolopsis buskii TaxID=27845 RepID=A0A8E0VGD9_9TREM|nr:1-acylglycerol-3-phosphate O-acyltransferase 6 (Lysophosphatidic acid acyltransferase zeta) [Fasciolopsis buski]